MWVCNTRHRKFTSGQSVAAANPFCVKLNDSRWNEDSEPLWRKRTLAGWFAYHPARCYLGGSRRSTDENHAAGLEIRDQDAAEVSGIYSSGGLDSGTGHWREHRHLF